MTLLISTAYPISNATPATLVAVAAAPSGGASAASAASGATVVPCEWPIENDDARAMTSSKRSARQHT